MPKKSSDSVKIISVNKKNVLKKITAWAKKLKKDRPEIEKIGLFGSFVTDAYGPFSDADILIVLKKSKKKFLDRIPDYIPENLSMDVDVFPYTIDEIAGMKQENNPWIVHILKECEWLVKR